jgi:hypothetical protein
MRIPKNRCTHCHDWFRPDPRCIKGQKFCSKPECRRQSRLESHRRWWEKNGRELDEARASKHREWARKTDYQRTYRLEHPEYVQQDNERRRRAHEALRSAVNQDMRREMSVGKLRDIQALSDGDAVYQDMILRRVDGIVDYLLWKEDAVNQDSTDLAATPA